MEEDGVRWVELDGTNGGKGRRWNRESRTRPRALNGSVPRGEVAQLVGEAGSPGRFRRQGRQAPREGLHLGGESGRSVGADAKERANRSPRDKRQWRPAAADVVDRREAAAVIVAEASFGLDGGEFERAEFHGVRVAHVDGRVPDVGAL